MDFVGLTAVVEVGQYISAWKTIPILIIFFAWARLLTWADKDAPAARLPREMLNIGLLSGMILGFALFFLLPGFWGASLVLLVVMAASAGTYLLIRKQKVGLGDLKQQFTSWIQNFGKKDKEIVSAPGEVQIYDAQGNPMAAPEAETEDRVAYDAVQWLLTNPLKVEAERLEMMPAEGGSKVRYYVDGVSYTAPDLNRANAAAAITYLKQASGLDIEDRRKPQKGKLKVAVDKQRRDLQIQTAGSAAGESLQLMSESKKRHAHKIEEMGFTSDQLEAIQQAVQEGKGIVLVAAPKTQGLTSLLYAILRSHDAFMSHIQTIERAPDQDLEGITQNNLPATASAAEEAKMTDWVSSQEPDVLMINQLEDPHSARALIKYAASGKRVYIGMRAGNTIDALAQWRKIVGDDKQAMMNLELIIAGRVIRRLCMACKVGYAPDPATLRKLNIDPDRVGKLYQARAEPLRDQRGNPVPCDFCRDLRFKGRIGVYEVFIINDDVRLVIQAGGSPNQLKAVFRKQHGRYLQEQALAQVEKGETSVQEVLRVLRITDDSPQASHAPSASAQKTPVKPKT